MRHALATLTLGAALFGATAAAAETSAQAAIRHADLRVAEHKQAYRRAERSQDSVTMAVARAKLKAAQAVAWGLRHPPAAPAPRLAAR